jgi:predicted kinase
VVDATANERRQRATLAAAARDAGTPLVWLEIDLPEAVVVERVEARRRAGDDPSDATAAVVRAQLASREPIGADELAPAGTPPVRHVRVGAAELADPGRLFAPITALLPGVPPEDSR